MTNSRVSNSSIPELKSSTSMSSNSGIAGEPTLPTPVDAEVVDPSPRQPRVNAVEIRSVIDGILKEIEQKVDFDRGGFTKSTVSTMRSRYSEFNWIICHTAHSHLWSGNRGVDWEHWHHELDVYGAGTIGYEIYWARSGVFSLNGDGGFENWAYTGNVQKLDGGRVLYFSP
ncbi:hypothetical protein NLJ89_g7627 [Agrocybe chaxingu]|uniref:Uncharacterized protein n=1 Tax=Agrocybe chaxingu TaxID=84603 RepID=A0A9W8MRK4_9AGAR|nr:hypothetical protein NLJ89_g7627 [Agrocybe chaxingu]